MNSVNRDASMKKLYSKGMAMLEVLIAMVVVAIGVLPLVYLQVKADRSVMSSYTKVEHNAAALSIMDMIAADANKNAWEFPLASGDCDSKCAGKWRQQITDNLLTDVLPNTGSSLVCITKNSITNAKGDTLDHSIKMTVTLWWYSAGRGEADIGGNTQIKEEKSKEGPFVADSCKNIATFADKLNIDTVSVTRIF